MRQQDLRAQPTPNLKRQSLSGLYWRLPRRLRNALTTVDAILAPLLLTYLFVFGLAVIASGMDRTVFSKINDNIIYYSSYLFAWVGVLVLARGLRGRISPSIGRWIVVGVTLLTVPVWFLL